MGVRNNSNIYDVNGKKLSKKFEEIFKETGKTANDIAEDIGYDRGYFTNVFSRGRIHKIAMRYLEREYGIALVDIVGEDEPEQVAVVEDVSPDNATELMEQLREINVKLDNLPNMRFGTSGQDSALNLTKEELMNVIYKAVYSAVKHAWENE